MYCTSCGKQIANDAAFCGYCGTPVSRGDTSAGLVAAARTGAQDAIGALYEKTYSSVYYTVKSMIRDENAVFDIVQDTYIKAFAHLEGFQGDEKFSPWVRQIAANTARDWLKKKRPMLFTELGSADEQDTPVEELFPDERSENLPDQIIDQKETKRLIREIIEELPEDQRAAIGMFYYEEMSVKEIAAAMDVSESAVKSRLMYGRNKIEKKILELEKQGTRLYSLAPLPFLLLLFRSQKAYAAEAPDPRILQAILASQPVGAAGTAGAGGAAGAAQGASTAGTATSSEAAGMTQGTDTVGAATGSEAAGTAGTAAGNETASAVGTGTTAGSISAGTAAASGGLGALKIGLIALAAVTVVGLGALGVTQITSRLAERQDSWGSEDVSDREEAEESEESETQGEAAGSEEPEALEETAETEEPDPIDETLEQYRTVIGQADSYDYGEYKSDLSWREFVGYRYALVQMQPDDPVPTLLLEREEMDTEMSVSIGGARVFQYDPDTKTLHQPGEMIGVGGIRGGLSMAGDGNGMMTQGWSGGTGEGSVTRITLDGDSLKRETCWEGRIDQMPDSITFIEIEWHEIDDLSAFDSWTAPDSGGAKMSESSDSGTLRTSGALITLTGTVGTYDYDEMLSLFKKSDPDSPYYDQYESARESFEGEMYRMIVLDTPQTLRLRAGEEGYFDGEALMINIQGIDNMDRYEGQHITFTIDPTTTHWPNDWSVPLGQPSTLDIRILGE